MNSPGSLCNAGLLLKQVRNISRAEMAVTAPKAEPRRQTELLLRATNSLSLKGQMGSQ